MKFEFAFGQWIYGLVAATIAAGAQSVSGGFALAFIDPAHFNLQQPTLIVRVMAAMFLFAAVPVFFAYLAKTPLPTIVTTTTKTTTLEDHPQSVTVKTVATVEEKHD